MNRREDYATRTEADAARFEDIHGDADLFDDTPTRREAEADECCPSAAVARARFCGCGAA